MGKKKKNGGENKQGEGDVMNDTDSAAENTTSVLKMSCFCDGCTVKIEKNVKKFKGVEAMSMDKDQQLVTIVGIIDVKKFVEILTKKLKRSVEILPSPEKKDNANVNDSDDSDDSDSDDSDDEGNENPGGCHGLPDSPAPDDSIIIYPGGPYPYAPEIYNDEDLNSCVVM